MFQRFIFLKKIVIRKRVNNCEIREIMIRGQLGLDGFMRVLLYDIEFELVICDCVLFIILFVYILDYFFFYFVFYILVYFKLIYLFFI